jgi:two-component system, OmpR family, KDP operon response regulator KdpE
MQHDGATAATPARVLIVEDDRPIRRFVRANLVSEGYRVAEAGSAGEGLAAVERERPDLVILDLGLPDRDGLGLVHELRGWSSVPIVIVSARDREPDKVAALDAGADDYLTKPFGVAELLARVRVALRHAAMVATPTSDPVFRVGDLSVDMASRRVRLVDDDVHLTPTEYRLLLVLVKHAGKVVTHRQLLREVWGPEYGDESHYVRVYMAQLRQKLESDPSRPRYLRTEPGVGYRLAVD